MYFFLEDIRPVIRWTLANSNDATIMPPKKKASAAGPVEVSASKAAAAENV